jgi:hypothetical protein
MQSWQLSRCWTTARTIRVRPRDMQRTAGRSTSTTETARWRSSRARRCPLSAPWAIPILPEMRSGYMPTANSFPKQSWLPGNCLGTGIPAMPGGCTTSTGRSRGRIGTVLWYVPRWTRLHLLIIWPATKTIFTRMMRWSKKRCGWNGCTKWPKNR